MALKQDYILRMIEELINVLIKTLKKDDKENVEIDDIEKIKNENEFYKKLTDLIENKKINEAENYLYEKLEENNKVDFIIGMIFYKDLNEKEDSFLEECNYSREEVLEGISDLSKMYGFGDFVQMFMKA